MAVPAGPRDHELMSLHELAVYVMVYGNLDTFDAARGIVRALLGDGELKGLAPSLLPVYRRFMSGPVVLDAIGVDGGPAPRQTALGRLLVMLYRYPTIDDIPEGSTSHDEVAGRFLAVVRADALRAFGLKGPPQPVQMSAPAPAARLVEVEPAPTPAADEDLPARRRRAVARLRELEGTKGARKKVAAEFNIDERTVGKWIEKVEEEKAAARADSAFSANLAQLQAS